MARRLLALITIALAATPFSTAAQQRSSASDLAVMHAGVAGVRIRDGKIHALDVDAELVNMGHGRWGRDGTVSFTLSRGTPLLGLEPLVEPCGAECTRPIGRSTNAPRGLAPGMRAAVRGRIVRRSASATLDLPSLPLDMPAGQWHTVEIAFRSRADGNATNDRLLLMFVLDERGEVVDSRTERPAERPGAHAAR